MLTDLPGGVVELTSKARGVAIRQLNDQLRTTMDPAHGRILCTRGVSDLGASGVADLARKVREFDAFEDGDDPYREHDFGAIEHEGTRYFWKIDYYAKDDDCRGSEDPADVTQTTRVMTIMQASEY